MHPQLTVVVILRPFLSSMSLVVLVAKLNACHVERKDLRVQFGNYHVLGWPDNRQWNLPFTWAKTANFKTLSGVVPDHPQLRITVDVSLKYISSKTWNVLVTMFIAALVYTEKHKHFQLKSARRFLRNINVHLIILLLILWLNLNSDTIKWKPTKIWYYMIVNSK